YTTLFRSKRRFLEITSYFSLFLYEASYLLFTRTNEIGDEHLNKAAVISFLYRFILFQSVLGFKDFKITNNFIKTFVKEKLLYFNLIKMFYNLSIVFCRNFSLFPLIDLINYDLHKHQTPLQNQVLIAIA